MWAIVILFVAGVALIFSEFFVPGGVLGIFGGLLVIGSIALGWYRYPDYGIWILTGEFAGVLVAVSIGLYLIFKTPLGSGLILKSGEGKEEGYANYERDPQLVGKLAKVHSTLRPAGSILLDGERIDAVSNGTFIEQGKTVRIIEVEGHRVVCEEAPEAEDSHTEEQPA